ncbi:MAG: hypothetical protein IIA83_09245 [Thaumarchaeota archaeon]|nr:hypothetical protein [Nitrososphaerota archaeon]
MAQVFEGNFDFEQTVYSDQKELLDIILSFNKKQILEKNSEQISINVNCQIIIDLSDNLNPTYKIKLNAI